MKSFYFPLQFNSMRQIEQWKNTYCYAKSNPRTVYFRLEITFLSGSTISVGVE